MDDPAFPVPPPIDPPSADPLHDLRSSPTKAHYLSGVSWLLRGVAALAGTIAGAMHFAPDPFPVDHMWVVALALWVTTLIAAGMALHFGFQAHYARKDEQDKANSVIDAVVKRKEAERVTAVEYETAIWRGRVMELEKKLAASTSAISRPVVNGSPRAVAVIKTLTATYNRKSLIPESYLLTCRVEFSGLTPGMELSPASLLVTAKGGEPRIAILETSERPSDGEKTYTADVKPEDLYRCLVRPGGGSTNIWPPQPGTLCDVEIRLPRAEALTAHRKSGVSLDFEVLAEDFQFRSFLVPIVDVTPPRKVTLDEAKEDRRRHSADRGD